MNLDRQARVGRASSPRPPVAGPASWLAGEIVRARAGTAARSNGTATLGGDPGLTLVRAGEHDVDLGRARVPTEALNEGYQRPQQRPLVEHLREVPLELHGVRQALVVIHVGEDAPRGGA